MGHYAAEMWITWSRAWDEALHRSNEIEDIKKWEELVNDLLGHESIHQKLETIKEWDRIQIKEVFLWNSTDSINDEISKRTKYPAYYYTSGGQSLYKKLRSFSIPRVKERKIFFSKVEDGNILLTTNGLPTQERVVSIAMQNMYRKKWEKIVIDGKESYKIDAKIVEPYSEK